MRLLADRLQFPAHAGVFTTAQYALCPPVHDTERRAQLMGDAAGDLPKQGQGFALPQPVCYCHPRDAFFVRFLACLCYGVKHTVETMRQAAEFCWTDRGRTMLQVTVADPLHTRKQ